MAKQVTKSAQPSEPTNSNQSQQNLFMSVETFDPQGKSIGFRIVDLYHFGTRSWLAKHTWWAMHNGNCVEQNVATQKQIDEYIASSKEALAEKFNSKTEAAPEVAQAA